MKVKKKGFIIGLCKKEIKWKDDEIGRTHKVQRNNCIGPKCYLWLKTLMQWYQLMKLDILEYQDGIYAKLYVFRPLKTQLD